MGRTRQILVVGIGAAVLAVAGAVSVLLIRGLLTLESSERELDLVWKQLRQIYDKDPFPATENIEQEKQNLATLQDRAARLTAELGKGLPTTHNSPTSFMGEMGAARNNLLRKGAEAKVTLAPEFTFGFDRYFGAGAGLPAPEDVPWLIMQVGIVEKLSHVFFEEKAAAILSLTRDVFETARAAAAAEDAEASAEGPDARTRPGRAAAASRELVGTMPVNTNLFLKMHFRIEFKATERSFLRVLDRFARHELFIVVTSVGFEKQASDVLPVSIEPVTPARAAEPAPVSGMAALFPVAPAPVPAAPEPAPTATVGEKDPRPLERIISGPKVEQPMKVIMDLDVYMFKGE